MHRMSSLLAGVFVFGLSGPLTAQQAAWSSWFGGAKADRLSAVVWLENASLVAGGQMEANRPDKKDWQGGVGVLLRVEEGKIVFRRPMPGAVSDLIVTKDGEVVATGVFGTVGLDVSLKRVLWESKAGDAESRVATWGDSGVVVLAGKKVFLVKRGKTAGQFEVGGSYVTDLVADDKGETVFVCGFDNKFGTPPGQKKYPVQVAFVQAFDAEGRHRWKSFGWEGQQVADKQLMADTRAYRLAWAAGKLYVAGESAGGNTMWSRDGLDLEAPVVMAKGDAYQNAYNTAANHITAVVRLDAATGRSELATLILARLGSGKGNTIRPRALEVDEKRTVWVGGASAYQPPRSEGAFGLPEGGGAWLIGLDGNFQRTYATVLSDGSVLGLAAQSGRLAAVGEAEKSLAVQAAFQEQSGGDKDGFLIEWKP